MKIFETSKCRFQLYAPFDTSKTHVWRIDVCVVMLLVFPWIFRKQTKSLVMSPDTPSMPHHSRREPWRTKDEILPLKFLCIESHFVTVTITGAIASIPVDYKIMQKVHSPRSAVRSVFAVDLWKIARVSRNQNILKSCSFRCLFGAIFRRFAAKTKFKKNKNKSAGYESA